MCLCGCGVETKFGNRFIHGHNGRGKNNYFYGKPSQLRGKKRSPEICKKMSIALKGRKRTPEQRLKLSIAHKGIPSPMRGKKLSPEHILKLSLSHKGKPSGRKGKKISEEQKQKLILSHLGKKLSNETKKKLSIKMLGRKKSIEHRKNIGRSRIGEKSHFWKGGVTKENELIRKSLSTKIWRESVFERDDFTCRICLNRGGELHPHHIESFALYPELRFSISNGITLCKSCHFFIHNHNPREPIKSIWLSSYLQQIVLLAKRCGLDAGYFWKKQDAPHIQDIP
jgi:hypothetical protein